MGLAITAFTGALASAGAATPAPGANLGYVALANSVPKTTDTITGQLLQLEDAGRGGRRPA